MSAEHMPSRPHERILLVGAALVVGALIASLMPSTPPSSGKLAAGELATGSFAVARASAASTRVFATTPSAIAGPRHESGLGQAMAGGLIMTGATAHRLILFTFDDGPDRRTTPLLLDRLDAVGVRAVFFLTGRRLGLDTPILRQQSMIARDIRARGHIVASHTYDHLQLPMLSDDDVRYQIVRAEEAFTQVFGERPWLIRPPGGGHSSRVDSILAERGYTTVLWNIGAGDFQVRSANDVLNTWRKVYARLESEGQRGGIVLLHDTYAWSVEAFQHIYNELQDRNCDLLNQGQELFDVVDDPSLFYVARNGAGASHVAPLLILPPTILEQRQATLREATWRRCRSLADRL